ncbi:DUF4129 domain-containing protein [Cellulomonas fengjieae]|uniref:DUF4129 domain-containing protein n=1 Tax=Cellulomonas fengjieae TaxID=2819978 RepID=A0ABS3SK55_9CELL|nr:DUF4129 domain-containing protein [Cellulomonas fengjieae]MBO3086125.1 DUF4129 domain-containing protein [Cellulomonas fengjieae]QVI65813.1 DUF4129 domain-containing protein [Cellulomonas fengjieae]
MAPQARRPSAVLLVGAFVVVAVVGAALAGPFQPRQRSDDEVFTIPPPAAPTATTTPIPTAPGLGGAQEPIEAQRWIYLVAIAVVGALLVLGFALLARRLRTLWQRRAPREVDTAVPDVELGGDVLDGATPALREGVRRAAQVLDDDVPPGDAVIAAWVALEASAERSGLVRDRAQTATEFTVEVLGTTPADPGATRDLLQLYLAARYSEHVLTDDDVARARASLAAIADDLGRRAGA